jgi:predicted DNA-binding transcriptional regulator AlpA
VREPRGIPLEQAAEYCGLTLAKFQARVKAGMLPRPLPFGQPRRWDLAALDRALDRLSGLTRPDQDDHGEAEALRAIHARQDALRHRKAKSGRP